MVAVALTAITGTGAGGAYAFMLGVGVISILVLIGPSGGQVAASKNRASIAASAAPGAGVEQELRSDWVRYFLIVHAHFAGVGSALPAGSVARTLKTCLPGFRRL